MALHKVLLPAVLLSATIMSGCSVFSGEKDVVTMSPLPKVASQFTPQKLWSTSVGSGTGDYYSLLHPAALGNQVFAADREGIVKALNADSGKTRWKIDLSEKTHFFSPSHPALLSGGITASGTHLYIGSERAKLYAIDAASGKVSWTASAEGEVLSSPVVSDGLVLIHTSNGMLQAFNETDGTVKWSVNLDMPALTLRGESAPAVAYGAAIVGGDNGRINAVLLNEGQMIWQQRIAQPKGATEIDRLSDVDMSPVIVGRVVYTMAYNGDLAALDLRTGQLIWKREIGGIHNILVEGNRIYLVDKDDRVVALNTEGGVVVWKQSELLHRHLTAPVLYNGYLVVADGEGYLHWLNTRDGRFVAQQKINRAGFIGQPVVVSDKLLLQTKSGKLYAYRK